MAKIVHGESGRMFIGDASRSITQSLEPLTGGVEFRPFLGKGDRIRENASLSKCVLPNM